MLTEFFAVTGDSCSRAVYWFYISGRSGYPWAEILELEGVSPYLIGSLLNGYQIYSRVAIAEPIIFYSPSDGVCSWEGKLERTNSDEWHLRVSEVVALFTEREEAKACFDAGSRTRLDPRWAKETADTWAKIGKKHRVFEVCDPSRFDIIRTKLPTGKPSGLVAGNLGLSPDRHRL